MINWAIIAGLSAHYDYTPGFLYGMSDKGQFLDYYIKPYTRLAPYVIGFACGILFRSYTDASNKSEELVINEEIHMKKDVRSPLNIFKYPVVRILGYAISIVLLLICALMPTQLNRNGPDYWSKSSKLFFMIFEHTFSTIAWCLMFMPVLCGHDRFIYKLLAFPLLAPLAKVSFAMYCLHPIFCLLYTSDAADE